MLLSNPPGLPNANQRACDRCGLEAYAWQPGFWDHISYDDYHELTFDFCKKCSILYGLISKDINDQLPVMFVESFKKFNE